MGYTYYDIYHKSNENTDKCSRAAAVVSSIFNTPFTRYNRLSNRLHNRFDNRLYTRYSRLSNRLSNGFDNRLSVCIHDTTG